MNNFLTLLTKQLEYQDPMSPMDNAEFTQQLVSFSIAEQSIENNKLLRDLVQEQKNNGWISQMALIGKEIEIDGESRRSFDGNKTDFAFSLPQGVDKAELRIFDTDNRWVQTLPLDNKPGAKTIAWDGTTLMGTKATPGLYQFKIMAKDSDGKPINAENIKLRGVIDSIDMKNGMTPMVDGIPIDFKKITRFYHTFIPTPQNK